MSVRVAAALVATALVLGAAAPAAAKSSRELPYAYEPVWSSLVRFLRVDEKLKLLEKDGENGYVLFELVEGKRTFSGAAELARGAQGGRPVRLTVRISDRPSYMEIGLIDRFELKLREELGEPPPAAPPPDAPAAPEGR